MTQARLVPPPPNEADYQKLVVELAHVLGYVVAHFRPAMTKHGWRTPAGADGKGWPDLVLVSKLRHRTVFAELKGPGGSLSREQKLWQEWLSGAGQEHVVWKSGRDTLRDVSEYLTPHHYTDDVRCECPPCKAARVAA